MDKCFNCGAAVRPGAKFCTSCGTRLIENSTPAATPAAATPQPATWEQAPSAEETQVAAPAVTDAEVTSTGADDDSGPAPFASWRHVSSGWNSGEETGTRDASPADRFEAGLEINPPADDTSSTRDKSFGWGQPVTQASDAEERFASWAAAYKTEGASDTSDDSAASTATDDTGVGVVTEESATYVPQATPVEADADDQGTDAAGFTASGEREIDLLSGDESTAASGTDSAVAAAEITDGTDARARASALVDELRGLIWTIGEAEPASAGDTTDVRNILSAVRGQTPDFSDLESAIAAVRESPKDIDALRELGNHAERLESLFESHARLTGALDDAIHKLR